MKYISLSCFCIPAFAVNLDVLLRNPKVKLNTRGTSGYLETDFLTMIATQEELEPRANNCTEVRTS